jgi:hypothetical protein
MAWRMLATYPEFGASAKWRTTASCQGLDADTRCQVPGVRCQGLASDAGPVFAGFPRQRTRCQVLVPDTRHLTPDTCPLEIFRVAREETRNDPEESGRESTEREPSMKTADLHYVLETKES